MIAKQEGVLLAYNIIQCKHRTMYDNRVKLYSVIIWDLRKK